MEARFDRVRAWLDDDRHGYVLYPLVEFLGLSVALAIWWVARADFQGLARWLTLAYAVGVSPLLGVILYLYLGIYLFFVVYYVGGAVGDAVYLSLIRPAAWLLDRSERQQKKLASIFGLLLLIPGFVLDMVAS